MQGQLKPLLQLEQLRLYKYDLIIPSFLRLVLKAQYILIFVMYGGTHKEFIVSIKNKICNTLKFKLDNFSKQNKYLSMCTHLLTYSGQPCFIITDESI